MKTIPQLIIASFLVSFFFHYLFISYFPVDWLQRLNILANEQSDIEPPQETIKIEVEIVDSSATVAKDSDSSKKQSSDKTHVTGKGSSGGSGLDQGKWDSLIKSLEENTGFTKDFKKTYEDLIDNSPVSESYIRRERYHEDIVIKEVFPTIYNIERPFDAMLKAAPKQLEEYEHRNEIIEQYRSQQSDFKTDLIVTFPSEEGEANLGPLNFPEAQRQEFFDETLHQDKNQQLSNFIDKYFQYDPNEGDLPLATKELYFQNLERLIYTFSKDPTYLYLDFYLENLNKEDFLYKALNQASELEGTKTSTELLLTLERIYEIQQRGWKNYFDFETLLKDLPADKKDRLRIETLRRANERYKAVLKDKGINTLEELEALYRQRRYEILEHIISNTPESYRLDDALFEQAVILWQTGLQTNQQKIKEQAINQWEGLINRYPENTYSENTYKEFNNLKHLKALDTLIQAYQTSTQVKKSVLEHQISTLLVRRQATRIELKREREERILWTK